MRSGHRSARNMRAIYYAMNGGKSMADSTNPRMQEWIGRQRELQARRQTPDAPAPATANQYSMIAKLARSLDIPVPEVPVTRAYGNDEAKLLEMDANVLATALYPYRGYDYLAGPIVLTGPIDPDGDETSVDPAIVEALTLAAVLA